MRIANFCEAFGNCENGEVGWIAIGNFMPVQRRRDTRVGKRAYGIGRACRTILRVLVVVEEDAVAFFLPPLRTRQIRRAALYRSRQSHCRPPNLSECPAWLDAH